MSPRSSDPQERLSRVFTDHVDAGEGGMSFVAYRHGAPLVSLHGGIKSRNGDDSWREDTLAVMFSGTKGLTATVAAILVDRGLLDPDAPVAEYWPEFAAAGKADARVSHVLSHTVGLLFVDPDPSGDAERLDNALMADRLAAQAPMWEPGTRVAYHAMTYGYLMSEIVRRASGGATVGQLIRSEIAEPFGLDLHLGLPESEEGRVAPVFQASGYRISTFLENDPERRAIVNRMYGSALTASDSPFNTRALHAAELSAGGGIGTADAMAHLYALLTSDDAPIVSRATLERCTREWSAGTDVINDRPVRFGLGYELDDPIGTYGPVRPAFGHTGAGGGLHGAWPERGIAFSFLTNEMRSEDVDRRAKDLLAGLAELDDAHRETGDA